jgi:thiamine biosynthesis lipoprotein
VTVPKGRAFDGGGIGKGLAADLASRQLLQLGVRSGVVNLGGDLRLWGDGPHDGRWHVALPDRTIAATDVGVATSGTARRSWTIAGRRYHHLIDPVTELPIVTDVDTATVIAPTAWLADVLAGAAVATPDDDLSAMWIEHDVNAVVVHSNGRVVTTPAVAGLSPDAR